MLAEASQSWALLLGFAVLALVAAFAAVGIILMFRRLHDLGLSRWWVLMLSVPVAGVAFMAFLLLWPGGKCEHRTQEENR